MRVDASLQGTENVAYIVALGKACDLIKQSWEGPVKTFTEADVGAAASSPPDSDDLEAKKDPCESVPHPSNLAFVAKVFVEAFWRSMENKTGSSRETCMPLRVL